MRQTNHGLESKKRRGIKNMNPDMEWDESTRSFVPRAQPSLSFLYNYNNNPYPGMEVKQAAFGETAPQGLLHEAMEQEMKYGNREKKRRLTSNQIESLERSFQKEIKLDTDRKMKLSRELGLQPRQIAVWFQNRRTRWKAKQLEHLYLALKPEFDHISQEKHKLQQEIMKLKAMLRQQAGYTEMLGKETIQSTSEMLLGSNKARGVVHNQLIVDGHCSFTVEDYSTVPLPHWTTSPCCP